MIELRGVLLLLGTKNNASMYIENCCLCCRKKDFENISLWIKFCFAVICPDPFLCLFLILLRKGEGSIWVNIN